MEIPNVDEVHFFYATVLLLSALIGIETAKAFCFWKW
jgi:hypothetical protein